ncbi:Serine/threonine-protein kinase polo [Gossypium arboreum]|uniref:Serine/threonine-protein kinase polo n=1 Tax=Gossypium arboreum TaxID=29729 RepID=A0A0B0NIG8_GOSAR|nr:Serine/threonine-protein kinase polo [Gossypium arboreum]
MVQWAVQGFVKEMTRYGHVERVLYRKLAWGSKDTGGSLTLSIGSFGLRTRACALAIWPYLVDDVIVRELNGLRTRACPKAIQA